MQVAGQVRDIRNARHLSQRQLAGRMQVPRTYISKIENGKAIPTLGSLERLAAALEVDVCQLVRDARSRREEEVPRSWPIRFWPRLPRCCRSWTRCIGLCSLAQCATWPWAPPHGIAAGRAALSLASPCWRRSLRGRLPRLCLRLLEQDDCGAWALVLRSMVRHPGLG